MLKFKGKSLLLSAMVAAMAVPAVAGAAPIDTKETEVKNESNVQLEIDMEKAGIKADEAFELDLSELGVTFDEAVKSDINLNLDELGIKADEEFKLDLSLLEVEDGDAPKYDINLNLDELGIKADEAFTLDLSVEADEASKTDTKLSEKPIVIDMKKEGLKEDQAFEYHLESSSVIKK